MIRCYFNVKKKYWPNNFVTVATVPLGQAYVRNCLLQPLEKSCLPM